MQDKENINRREFIKSIGLIGLSVATTMCVSLLANTTDTAMRSLEVINHKNKRNNV